jgi:uncharacterized protein YbaP (TraB family)
MAKKIKFKHHPGYDYKKGVDWNVKRGIDYAKKHHLSLEDVKKQLNFLANLNKNKNKKVSDIYKKAAKKVSSFGKKLKTNNNEKKNKKGKIEKEIIDFFKEDKEKI